MKIDQIEVGKTYHNGKGRKRRVLRHELKRWNKCVWYTPINEKGKEGAEQYCVEHTFAGWAAGEWDPNAAVWTSPKRDEAGMALYDLLCNPTATEVTEIGKVIAMTVEAAKEEMRKELGFEN